MSRRIAVSFKSAVLVLGTIALAGCQTASEGFDDITSGISDEVSNWEWPDIGNPFDSDSVGPLTQSVSEEYCIATQVAVAYGGSDLAYITSSLTDEYVKSLTPEEKAKSLYCDQNLGGIVLVTDRVMNEALIEVGQGVQLAGEALELNVASQQATLARIARMKNLSLGDKMDPAYQEELEQLNREIDILSDSVEQKLAELAASGGISPQAEAKLVQAHQHFMNFRHAQGKAIAGFTFFEAARRTYGNEVIGQAFVEALRIDQAKNNTSQEQPQFGATQELTDAFLGAIPKFGETMVSGGRMSSAIADASDTDDYQEAIEAIDEPQPQKSQELVEFASDVEASASGLGLPSATEIGSGGAV